MAQELEVNIVDSKEGVKMEILELIKKRRTIRDYKKKKVSQKLITKIIEAGIWAPSPHNSQPWEFIVIKDSQIKEKFIKMIDELYEHKGLDNNGVPKPETLRKLDLDKEPSHLV